MKSIKDIQKVAVALAMVIHGKQSTKEEKDIASKTLDVLLWASDYPNNFRKFAEPIIKECPFEDEELDRVFEEAVAAHEQEGTVTE